MLPNNHFPALMVQNDLCGIVGNSLFSALQLLSYRHNITSLLILYCYFSGKYSDKPYSLVQLVQFFAVSVYWISSKFNCPHFPFIRFHLDSNCYSGKKKKLLCVCFPEHHNLKLFKSKVNCYLFSLSSWSSFPSTSSFTLPQVALESCVE